MLVLSLDISSKTGWALLSGNAGDGSTPSVIGYGTLELPKRVKDYGDFPWAIHHATAYMAGICWGKIQETQPDVVVIECVNKGKNRMSQLYLDITHGTLWQFISKAGLQDKVFYVDSSEWRKVTGSIMDKASKKANAKLSAAKRKAAQKGSKLDRKALGIRGKVTKKHVAINTANEIFGLTLKVKDNDIADALLEGLSYLWGAKPTVMD